MFTSICMVDGIKTEEVFKNLKCFKAIYIQGGKHIFYEALSRSRGSIRDFLSSMPEGQLWEDTHEELKKCFF